MRERQPAVGFVAGLGMFCLVALVSGLDVGIVGLLLVTALAPGLVLASVRMVRHARLTRGMRAVSVQDRMAGIQVHSAPLHEAAFVAGLGRPTIFCDRRLPERVTERELRAILLHEQAHQRSWDPVRLLLLDVIAPVVRRLPWGAQWLAIARARREIAADRYAMANGADRADLAAALLKLPAFSQTHAAGFTSAADLRLRALLGDGTGTALPSRVRLAGLLIISGLLGAAACTLLLHWLLATTASVACC